MSLSTPFTRLSILSKFKVRGPRIYGEETAVDNLRKISP